MTEEHGSEDAVNMRIVGATDLDGFGDGMHVNIRDGYAYVGHMGESRVGTSVVDVSDPADPRVVHRLETPPGTHSHKVQVTDDLLIVNYEHNFRERNATSWEAGLKIFDISAPTRPREIGFFRTPGKGVHRMTYWHPPYVFMSGSDEGFTDQFLIIADLTDPSRPTEVGRWWMPGMNVGAGEEPWWGEHRRFAAHHAIVAGDRAYMGWWDAGLVILDISDLERPELVSHLDFGEDVSQYTHTALPLPEKDVVLVTDEALRDNCQEIPKHVRVVNVADEQKPVVAGTFPVPEGNFCERGGRFGPHNLHEPKPGTLQDPDRAYLTYFNAGVRVYDVSDPLRPVETGYCIPPSPPGQPAVQANDITVDADGLIYVTDRFNGGLWIMEYSGR